MTVDAAIKSHYGLHRNKLALSNTLRKTLTPQFWDERLDLWVEGWAEGRVEEIQPFTPRTVRLLEIAGSSRGGRRL